MLGLIGVPIGYLLGSIPFSFIIARIFGIHDLRKVGSGNVGATNVWRAAGRFAGTMALIGDIGKGMAAVIIASLIAPASDGAEYLKLASGLAAIIGHIYPLFLNFRGGKGVNTALGVMLILLPLESLLAFLAFIITVVLSKYISLGSMVAAGALLIIVWAEYLFKLDFVHPVYLPVSLLLAGLIIYTHRTNIKRLMTGTENRFSMLSRKGGGNA
ncbi:Glycerol-3-phosphate acyltransferase [Candidatus Zixiibacteriota bacterium]|nr:Glycerol-3-phosphate acyltransferase [candidate division Zixibacteria bacterium]